MWLLSSTDREASSSFLQIPSENSNLIYGWSLTVFSRLKVFQMISCLLTKILNKNSIFFFFQKKSAFFFGSSVQSVQFSSVTQSCPTPCYPMNHSTTGLPVHHQLAEFTQTHVYQDSDAIQPSHPLLSPYPPAPNLSQHQSLFQWVNSSHEVAKGLQFQL